MKNIVSAMQALRNCLIEHINDYIAENNTQEVAVPVITGDMVRIDTPDIDKLPYSTMIYIIPDYIQHSPESTCMVRNTDNVKVWVFCKRDKNENLVGKACAIYSSILQTILNYRTLMTGVNLADFQSADFYPAIAASNTMAAFEINISLMYALHV